MLKTCLNCDNLVLVMGTFICNLHKQIIHYPNKSGQFCENYMEATDENTNASPKEKPATDC